MDNPSLYTLYREGFSRRVKELMNVSGLYKKNEHSRRSEVVNRNYTLECGLRMDFWDRTAGLTAGI